MNRLSLLIFGPLCLFIAACQPKGSAGSDTPKPPGVMTMVGEWQLVSKTCDGAGGAISPLQSLRVLDQGASVVFIHPTEDDAAHRCMKTEFFNFVYMKAPSQSVNSVPTVHELAGQLKELAAGTKCWKMQGGAKVDKPYQDDVEQVDGDYKWAHFTQTDNSHLKLEADATPFCGGHPSVLQFDRIK